MERLCGDCDHLMTGVNELIASVRILKYQDKDIDTNEPFQIGYLRVNGAAPVGITCDGP